MSLLLARAVTGIVYGVHDAADAMPVRQPVKNAVAMCISVIIKPWLLCIEWQ